MYGEETFCTRAFSFLFFFGHPTAYGVPRLGYTNCCSSNTGSSTHCARLEIEPTSQCSRDTTDLLAPQREFQELFLMCSLFNLGCCSKNCTTRSKSMNTFMVLICFHFKCRKRRSYCEVGLSEVWIWRIENWEEKYFRKQKSAWKNKQKQVRASYE